MGLDPKNGRDRGEAQSLSEMWKPFPPRIDLREDKRGADIVGTNLNRISAISAWKENERRLKDDLNDRLRTSSATSVPFSSRRTEIVGGTEKVKVYILSDLISSSVSIYL